MKKISARRVLESREACEEAFDIEIEAQNVIDLMSFLTDAAIRGEEEFVQVPTPWAAAAVLMLKGHEVRRPANRPRDSAWTKRQKSARRVRKQKVVDSATVEMLTWVVWRLDDLKREARLSGTKKSADDLRLQAATEAKKRFVSKLSATAIADMSRRPGRFGLKPKPRRQKVATKQ